MIELLIGLAFTVCILIVFSVYQIKKNGRLSQKLKQMEGILNSIDSAHDAISEQIKAEEKEVEKNEDLIITRDYFSD